MITFNCPGCGKKFAVPEEHAGRKARCPGCKGTITIPSPAGAAPQRPRQQPAASRQPAPAARGQAGVQEARQSSPADVANALKTRMAAPPRHVARGGLWMDKRIVIGLLGAGILFLGAFMPAVTRVSGLTHVTEATDGTLVFIGIALASIFFTLIGYFRALVITGLMSLGELGYLFVVFESKASTGILKDAHATWGWGVLLLGAITLTVAGVLKE